MMLRNLSLACTLYLFSAQAATVGDTDRFIPLIHDGGGWSTQITIINLSSKNATVLTSFMTARGFAENWKVELTATQGKVNGPNVESLPGPGATTIIETSGKPADLARGFADITELQDQPLGAVARLTKTENGLIVQSFTVPLSPANESRSVVPVDLTDANAALELIWVSPTNSTTLDIAFRKDSGEIAFTDTLTFNGAMQIFSKPLETWPRIAGLRGALEWKVSFPSADRYEYRFLSGLSILSRAGQIWAAVPPMTLKADQLKTSPY